MSVLELGSAFVTPFDPRRRASDRRARDPALRPAAQSAAASPPTSEPAFLAPVVVPDLSQLATQHEPPPPSQAVRAADHEVYAHLEMLVAAIREGDFARARAVVETLETQMLVERSAAQASQALHGADPAGPALARASAPLQAADAIYETLAHYLVTDEVTF